MSLPTVEKTWLFNVNHNVGSTANNQLLLDMKNMLIGTGSIGSWTDSNGAPTSAPSTWTVQYSCNGTTAGTPGDHVDRWLVTSSLVPSKLYAPNAHSWIVLKNASLDPGSNFQMLLDWVSDDVTDFGSCNIIVSRTAGFTGGSTTVAPTATDSVFCGPDVFQPGTNNGAAYYGIYNPIFGNFYGSSPGNYTLHCMISNDGLSSRIIVSRGSYVSFILAVESLTNGPSGWTTPIYLIHAASIYGLVGTINAQGNSDAALVPNYIANQCTALMPTPGLKRNLYLMQETMFATEQRTPGPFNVSQGYPFQTQFGINSLSGDYLIAQIDLASSDSGFTGRMGYVTDMWSCAAPPGSTFPPGGPISYAQFGTIIVPWNASSPVI